LPLLAAAAGGGTSGCAEALAIGADATATMTANRNRSGNLMDRIFRSFAAARQGSAVESAADLTA
jgi:hypothetical protein